MNPLKIEDLIPGATYLIDHQDGDHGSWVGRAIFLRANPPGYASGVLEFDCLDEYGVNGYFDIGDVKKLVSAPVTMVQRAERIADAILNDISGRSGIGDELDQISKPVMAEMKSKWIGLIEKELAK